MMRQALLGRHVEEGIGAVEELHQRDDRGAGAKISLDVGGEGTGPLPAGRMRKQPAAADEEAIDLGDELGSEPVIRLEGQEIVLETAEDLAGEAAGTKVETAGRQGRSPGRIGSVAGMQSSLGMQRSARRAAGARDFGPPLPGGGQWFGRLTMRSCR